VSGTLGGDGILVPDPAEQVRLGRTSLAVSRLAVGTNPFGNLYEVIADGVAEAAVAAAYEAGVRYFDTAPLYGYGLAEERLGRALAGVPRDSFVISTKVGRTLSAQAPPPERGSVFLTEDGRELFPGAPPRFPQFDYSEDGVRRSLSESLERLGLDRVDMVYIHDPDDHYEEALAGAYPALDRLRDEGTIGAIGVGMNQTEMLARFAREADIDCFMLAGRYSLLDQSAAEELFPVCLERGIAIALGGVLNGGILADPGVGMYDYRPADHGVRARVDQIADICARHGVALPAAAIQFAFGHPAVTSVVLGVRSPEELAENLDHLSSVVPEALWADLETAGVTSAPADPKSPESKSDGRSSSR
jgi:D-threo-aldose 1-dehydrogenase